MLKAITSLFILLRIIFWMWCGMVRVRSQLGDSHFAKAVAHYYFQKLACSAAEVACIRMLHQFLKHTQHTTPRVNHPPAQKFPLVWATVTVVFQQYYCYNLLKHLWHALRLSSDSPRISLVCLWCERVSSCKWTKEALSPDPILDQEHRRKPSFLVRFHHQRSAVSANSFLNASRYMRKTLSVHIWKAGRLCCNSLRMLLVG